ncbi:extracellular solute-binding protein [Paenibacillus camelliae]|uniref:extracellular solute-binding protein n=1 Tax=Paenibacillus camelliae TaxID=512410 RepID=UPI00203B0D02|nr:extracellular solute-binding protein [Paenibacillus camelliae]MCM3634849.1 extracellular solute-binding protein [Paenibacillus camelliae]
MFKAAKLGLVGILIVVLLAACGSNSSSDGSTNKSTEKITLTIWNNWSGQDAKAVAMRKILEDFQSENPNITLEIEALATDGLKTRLRTAAAADEMPDLFVMWPGAMTKEFVQGDLLQPINEFLDQNAEWKNNFIENALVDFTVEDNIYSVPMNLAPSSLLYYNEDLFKQYNVKVPTTWDELLQAVDTFNANNIIPIALGNKANWVAQSTTFSTIGDRVTGTEWFLKAVDQSGASFTDPEFIEALKLYQELGEAKAYQEGFNSIDENQMLQLYTQGKAAMVINGGWAVAGLVNTASEEILNATNITILPTVDGGKGAAKTTAGVVGTGLGVNKKLSGAKKDAAMKLFYALAGPDGQKATLESSTLISYNLELDPSKANPLFIKLTELMKETKIVPVYDSKLSSAAVEAINNGLQELLLGGDPEDIAKRIQAAQAGAVN